MKKQKRIEDQAKKKKTKAKPSNLEPQWNTTYPKFGSIKSVSPNYGKTRNIV